jgi:hypothetical protein
MGKRRTQKPTEALPDLLRSQCPCEVFNATWADVPPAEEQLRRKLAAQLVEGRLSSDYLKGSSTHGEVFG